MDSKYFLVNPKVNHLSGEAIASISSDKIRFNASAWDERERMAQVAFEKQCNLKWVHGRVIVKVNAQSKNTHRFANGATIRRERNFNNLNFREVNPANATVISSENIPSGSEILVDYTSIHDSNRIFDYHSGSSDIIYYSIKEEDCFGWKHEGNDWQPLPNFEFGLRVFKPYEGMLQGIPPVPLYDTIYVTTGGLKGNVVRTLKASDYQIVFQGANGQEDNIIRFRHSDNPQFEREEVIGIMDELTEQLNNGELYVGITMRDAQTLNHSF